MKVEHPPAFAHTRDHVAPPWREVQLMKTTVSESENNSQQTTHELHRHRSFPVIFIIACSVFTAQAWTFCPTTNPVSAYLTQSWAVGRVVDTTLSVRQSSGGISRSCGKLIGNVMSGLVMKVEHPPPFARTNGHFARPWCGVDLMSCEKHGEQCKADNT